MSSELAAPAAPKTPVYAGPRGLQLQNIDEMWRFAGAVSKSGLAPKGIERQESVFIALQMAAELGLSPMAGLQNIAIINGRPGIFGDAALALVRGSNLLDEYDEWYEVHGKRLLTPNDEPRNPTPQEVKDPSCTCFVLSRRAGVAKPKVEGFSTADAQLAGLWGKAGPWTNYPARMLKFRARGFNLRDNFGDVLKGFRTTEELQDLPAEREVTGRVVEDSGSAPRFGSAAPTEGETAEPAPTTEQPESAPTASTGTPQPKEAPAEAPVAKVIPAHSFTRREEPAPQEAPAQEEEEPTAKTPAAMRQEILDRCKSHQPELNPNDVLRAAVAAKLMPNPTPDEAEDEIGFFDLPDAAIFSLHVHLDAAIKRLTNPKTPARRPAAAPAAQA